MDKNTRERIYLPVITECGKYKLHEFQLLVLENTDRVTFESSVPLESHKQFNTLLNNNVEKVNNTVPIRLFHRDLGNTLTPTPSIPLLMKVFSFRDKTRITRDQKSGKDLGTDQKVKLWNLNLHVPQSQFDIRFTLNIETIIPVRDLQFEPTFQTQFQRHKDRISYVNENMGDQGRFNTSQCKSATSSI